MGAAIGAAVSVIEEVGKDAWLTVLTGAKEGRSYILSKQQTTIGRNEMADIPLLVTVPFLVLMQCLTKSGGPVSINAASGSSIPLTPKIRKVRISLTVTLSASALTNSVSPPPMARANVNRSPRSSESVLTSPNKRIQSRNRQTRHQRSRQGFQAATGPHSGLVYSLAAGGGPMTVGRDLACDVALPKDGMASRLSTQPCCGMVLAGGLKTMGVRMACM